MEMTQFTYVPLWGKMYPPPLNSVTYGWEVDTKTLSVIFNITKILHTKGTGACEKPPLRSYSSLWGRQEDSWLHRSFKCKETSEFLGKLADPKV